MESNSCNRGDLTDIIRTGGGAIPPEEWQFTASNPVNACTSESGRDDFGYPFTHFGDPLLDETETPAGSGYFHSKPGSDESRNTVGFVSGAGDFNHSTIKNMMGQRINLEQEIKRPNYFSRTVQISPVSWKIRAAPCGSPSGAFHPQNRIISRNFPVESSTGLQIPSPRNTGVRRRKSQVKKVVCIPAPTPANSRPSGEIVPSDLWAWRKYGQKPIKGSPYPRSYYRCSSSRGCSARKQVERSRTDPNMLVIIYTSGHNHPWPTQRNSLAGSPRSQPSKTNGPKANSQAPQKETVVSQKTTSSASAAGTTHIQSVKDETDPDPLEMDDPEFDGGSFSNSYRPVSPGSNRADDSFFADLGEIEVDSLDSFWFSGGDGSGQKGMDRFSSCDWDWSSGDAKKDS